MEDATKRKGVWEMKMEKLKTFLTFDLPLFSVWIAKQPFREAKQFLTGLRKDFELSGKPRNAMTFFLLLVVVTTFTGRTNLMLASVVGFFLAWVAYHYSSKSYVKEYRDKKAEGWEKYKGAQTLEKREPVGVKENRPPQS